MIFDEFGLKGSQYVCEICKQNRFIKLDDDVHKKNVNRSNNGLALYSDIHLCKDGMPGINNLRIDANYAVRSIENQELPPVKKASKFAIPGVPSTSTSTQYSNLYITESSSFENLRIIIIDDWLLTKITIGEIDPDNELPINTVNSDLGGITLKFYSSEIVYTPNTEKWLMIFINSLELLPPTIFGLIIETLKYILVLIRDEPTEFDIKMLKTMLASHEIYFSVVENADQIENLSSKFDEGEMTIFRELISHHVMQPELPLQYYIKKFKDKDLEYIIYMILILENENFILVDRPGIIDAQI